MPLVSIVCMDSSARSLADILDVLAVKGKGGLSGTILGGQLAAVFQTSREQFASQVVFILLNLCDFYLQGMSVLYGQSAPRVHPQRRSVVLIY
jgi:hypothetical protein